MPTLARLCTPLLLAATAHAAFHVPPQESEPLPDAARLLDAADAKIASPAARAKLGSFRATGSMEAMGMKMSVEALHLGAERASLVVRIPKMAPMTMGIEPRFAWTTDPAMGILTVAGGEAASVRRLMGFGRLAPWRELYARGRTVGVETLEGQACWKLEMLGAEGATDQLFVRQSDGLPLCVALSLPDFRKESLAMRFFFEDWQPVGDVLFPKKRRQVVGGYDLATRYERIEPGAKVEESEVAPPADVLQHWEKNGARPRTKALAPGECRIEEVEERHALAVRLEIREQDVAKTLAVILPEVMQALGELGVTPAGPPYSRYHRIADGQIDLEGGIPVREPLAGRGRVKPVVLPGGLTATTWHHGDYQQLTQSHALLERWVGEQKLRSRGALYEIYWTDPGLEPDPKQWRTQLLWPVEKVQK
jgi:effector-binding domain-containing protein